MSAHLPPTRRPSCRHHCARCGRHFASLVAFGRHLGWIEREGHADARTCDAPASVAGLRVQTDAAVCRIPPNDLEGVALWEPAAPLHASEQEAIRSAGRPPAPPGTRGP